MTFRPSDDVLDEIANDQQVGASLDQYYNSVTQWTWEQLFHNADDEQGVNSNSENINQEDIDVPVEEVKSPDLSQLLQESWWQATSNDSNDFSLDLSEIQSEETNQVNENNESNLWEDIQNENETKESDWLIPGKLADDERVKLVSKIDWSIHGNLDLLVDKEWLNTVEKYKKIHRIIFRWWSFIFTAALWVLVWVIFQVNAKEAESYEIVWDATINNKWSWIDNSSEAILSNLKDKWVETLVSYWSANIAWKTFQSKSNLIKYKWIVLPQLASVNYESEIFSLDKFKAKETTRKDIEEALDKLILNSSIYQRTNSLSNNAKRQWQTFQWWLIEWFSLSCLSSNRAFDVVCDKFVDIFYEYWKYFDLSHYASDLYNLTRELKNQHKDIEPICKMVQEYTRRSGVISSDFLKHVMEYCDEDDQAYYNKMVSFIEIENSLNNPELSDKVFDNPDLNAYKLLSAMQKLHNFLEMNQINENFTDSYLKYVQALVNKDRWTNKYLDAFYKDLMYVFNEDYLLKWLTNTQQGATKASLLRNQLDQINNGNVLYGSQRLLSMLTTPDIVKDAQKFITWAATEQQTIDDLFLPYRTMNDSLSIRRVEHIWDNQLRVQTEIFSDAIMWKTNGETLKATITLSRENNALYVDEIRIANQIAFTEVLNIYAREHVTLNAMLVYINDQVDFHYEDAQEQEEKVSLCTELWEDENVVIYSCSDSEITLYKWEIEYHFEIENWILEKYTISDEKIAKTIKDLLNDIMMNVDNTPTIIASIVDYEPEVTPDKNLEKKLEVIDQFRIHFKIVPNVYDIEWEDDIFMVEFTLWDYDLQARYNIETHLMTRISYVACEKTLEIRNLTIEVSVNNEAKLTEILNNPRIFLTNANQAAFKRYQTMCNE